jgi:transcriptional antiterminator RfaH
MPILQAETAFYPQHLFSDSSCGAAAGERSWWLMHTRPRQEKCLARDLEHRQVPFFLPLVPHRFRISGRAMTSYLPLFPGYVFVLAADEDRYTALCTGRIARSLPVPNPDGLWRDLQQIQRLIAANVPLTKEDRLGPGSIVEIKSGPLAGLNGKILRHASKRRFVVEVNFIQQGASVLLDDFVLSPV